MPKCGKSTGHYYLRSHSRTANPFSNIRCEQAQLRTTQKTLVVKRGQAFFKSQQGGPRTDSTWTVYQCQTDADNGQFRYAFQHGKSKKVLILQDNNVKLQSVEDVSRIVTDEKCLFEWCIEKGNKGSLKSVAKDSLYLGNDKEKLVACSHNPAVFELPSKINDCQR